MYKPPQKGLSHNISPGHILKIQGNSKYCKQHGDSCEDCCIFGQIYANFTKKLIFKKHRVSYQNLFLLCETKPTRYLTLQEDHNVSIYGLLFWSSGPKIWKSAQRPPKKVKIQVCFYQSLTYNKLFLKWSHRV